ncbi:hypothetical protein L914_05509 [Phytophthora nicotianae]|uniref:MIR domain-containing protein n=1 Tax=Phytophthora nicotianae TaxID=4792 RepID=W2NP77_PHYNI|nr:hypothetical protein L914_05509 [Phytophthora nicotianae]
MDNTQEKDLPRPMRVPNTPPVLTKRPPTLRQQPRAVSVRAPKSRPMSGTLQIRVEEQEQEQVQSQRNGHIQEQKEEEVAPASPPAVPTTLRQKDRSGSINSARPRPFGGKLRIDVDAAEMVAPPIIGSPLSYYTSKKLPSNTHEDHPVSMFTGAESNTGSGLLSTASPFLEYGMIVSLVCDDRGGLVAAEGFASRDVRLERLNYGVGGPVARLGLGGKEERRLFAEGGFRLLSCPFRDCLFEVVPKMTYDATIALRSLLDDTTRQPNNQHTVDNLRFKSEAETRLNAMMYKKLKGTQVIYGQTIQLRHTKSGKYVSLDPSPIPFRGSEYAPVFLDAGGPSSHFNVLPRFKLRSKGAPVQLTDQMILTGGTESQPYNLFVSNRKTTDGVSTAVVGSSVHSSQWRAVYYDNLDGESFTTSGEVRLPARNDEGLRAGSCIRLLHLESSSWLGFHGSDARDALGGPVTLHFSDEGDQEDGAKKALSSDCLWEIEHVFAYEGGQIKWREAITLRHLITGKYLAVTHSQSPRATTRPGPTTRQTSHICAQTFAQDQPQLFRFVPTAVADEESQIENGEVVLIQHQKTNSFLHSIDTHASTMADIRLSSKPLAHNLSASKSGAGSGETSFTVVTLHGARDEDAFKVIRVPQTEVTDTLLLISYKQALNQFLDQFRMDFLTGDRSSLRFERESTVGVFRRIENVLGELVRFCVKADEDFFDQLRCRQNLFRTYQYIELLVAMIKAPFQCYSGPFSIEEVCSFNDEYMNSRDTGDDNDELEMKGSPVRLRTDSSTAFRFSGGSSNSRDLVSPRRSISTQDNSWRRKSSSGVSISRLEIHIAAMQSLNRIIPAINVLLLHISWANRTNELYVVKVAMPVLMELLGNGFQTSLPLSYLLRENRNLVESITGCASIIRNFFELIATRGKSIRYMQFLVALCTSRGKGVPKTQEAICELLFNPANGYRDDVIIPIRPSRTGFDVCTSNHVTSDINQDIEVMFNRSAKTSEAGSSTGTWISLTKFYEEYYAKAKHRALGQYCYGLFRLYVSLCLDRNYISIEYIQTAFPRDNILYSVMDPHLSRSLRSVMMDLLRVAYVDCEPQKSMSCPNYTRIWTDIGASAAKALPSSSYTGYSPEDLAFFTSLKNFSFSYLDHLQGTIVIDEIPENELTLAILRVSRKLAEFGMYSSEDELSRVVVLLFDLLDERTDFVHEHPDSNGIHNPDIKNVKAYTSSTSLFFPPVLHLRQKSTASNVQAPQQRKMSLVSDRRPGWGAQPSPHLKNAVLFDGAGAMSSIRVTKERDATKQYKTVDRNLSRSSSGINSVAGTNTDSNPHRHLNKLLMHKTDVRTADGINVYEMNEVNRTVMEIKDEICAIFLLVDQVRVDFLISTLLASFQARHGGPPSSSPTRHRDPDAIHTALFDDAIVRETVSNAFTGHSRGLDILPHGHTHVDKMSPLAVYLFGAKSLECKLSLTRLGRRVVTTIFMQMLMYEYPPLVSKALELLLQQYNQHDQFLKEMQNVQLLVSEETISIYSKLKGDVDELRRLAETTEVWMDLTSRSDFEKASSVCQLLQSLLRVIEHTTPDTQVAGVETRPGGARRQLRIHSPGKSISDDESSDDDVNSAADLLSTNSKCTPKQVSISDERIREPTHDLTIEKQPPNRKLKYQTDRYVLNPAIGRVSQFSCSHDLVPPLWKTSPIGKGDASTTTGDTKDGCTIAMEARRLLRNLRAAQFVLSMLIDGAHFYEGHFSDDSHDKRHSPGSPTTRSRTKLHKRQRDQIRGVFGQAMQFLRAFCMDDAENQALVAPHATMIAEYVRELPIAQELLVVIYVDNFSLYKSVPTELINIFVGRLIHDGPDPRYLFFLETLVLCDEQPIVENQLLVLFQLVKSFENAKVLQMFDDATQTVGLLGGLLSRHTNLLQGTVNTNRNLQQQELNSVDLDGSRMPQTNLPDDLADTGKILEYHVRLLNLFAACGTGKNTRVQEICQQILPLVSVLDLLCHDDCTEGLQFALLRFLDQIFLTADDIETPGVDDLQHIMVVLTQICERRVIQYLSYIQVKDLNRQATLSLQKNKSMAGKVIGLSAQKPLESAPLYLVLFSIIPTMYSFIQQFSSFVDTNEEAQYYLIQFNSYVALLLMICATSNWQLPDDVVSNMEEFIYVIDKSVRPIMLQYQLPMQTSLEQAWSMSLKYRERLDCSSLNCELELPDMLQWALDMRDQEIKTDTFIDESKPSSLPEASPSDTKDVSPLVQAVRDGTSNGSSVNGFDARTKTATFKLDNLSMNKPIAWGDSGSKQPNQENKESSTGRAENTFEAVETKNRGRLLHRLSPRRYYKGLRYRSALSYLSPKKETPVTPFSSPAERRVSDAFVMLNSLYQSDPMNYLFRQQQQQFSELDQLLAWLQAHPRVHGAMRDELNQMVQGILGIETSMREEYNPHVHVRNVVLSFDLVVAKLVENVAVLQDPSYFKTNLTLLNVFCRMIYAVEDADERHNMQVKLNQLGVTRLVVQLISSRDNDALFTSSIEVGVALLDGMNAEVQESFYSYWSEPTNEQFFGRIQGRIEKACKLIHSVDRTSVGVLDALDSPGNVGDKKSHRRQSIFGLNLDNLSGDKPSSAERGGAKRLGEPITSIFRFLQLLCEGHYLNAQRALIAQPNATVSANLVESTTSFLLDTYLALTDLDMGLITQLFETITEYCQGPCVAAQETVANYKFISAVNALLTHTFEQRDTRAQDAVHKLRAAIVITLLSLLEGRSDHVIHSQLVQELNFEALKMNLVEVYVYFLRTHGTYAGNVNCSQDFYLIMGFNIYILLQQLADQNTHQAWWIPASEELQINQAWLPLQPTRNKVLSACNSDADRSPDFRDAFRFFQANCAKVEVVWDHHRSPTQCTSERTARGNNQGVSKADSFSGFSGSVVNAPSADSDDVSTSCTGALMPFYFPIHPICFCLTAKSKEKLVWDVSRGGDKLSDFYIRSDKLVDEMTHQSYLQHHVQVAWIARKSEEMKRVSFTLAVIINLVVLLFYRATGVYSRPFPASDVTFVHTWGKEVESPKPSLWIDVALSLAGTVQIILYSMVLICYMLNSAPLLIKKGWKRRHRKEQAKHAKRSVHSSQHRATEGKRESFQDTEQLLRSLREREEEYNYLFLPPSIRKRSAPKKREPISPRVKASGVGSAKTSGSSDPKNGVATARGDFRVQLEITTISLYFLVRSPRVIYSLMQIFISVLGAYVNKLYFAFLLLDVVDRYKELNNVLRSISRPAKALGVTTLLYLIVVYVFAVVGFFFFREDYTQEKDITKAQIAGRAPYTCQRLFQCFLVSLDQGLKSDGGLGSYLRQIPLGTSAHSYGRLAFDVLYNILLVVLLLNLIFGVIIDTFASLRTNDQEKILDMQGRCFICSIDAYTFDRATKRGFHDHISRDHNMWHYLYLFVHIRKKNITDYNGLELFLAMRMAKKDMSFFPTHRALSLTKRGDLEENHELDSATDDDRFYAASTAYGPKRYPATPFSPSRGASFASGAPSSRRGSDQSRARARSKRNSSGTTRSRSVACFDSIPGVQPFDRAIAGNLERIESTINELANAQIEIKEAQRRAEDQYTEILSTISGWQQQQAPLSQFPTPTTSMSGVSTSGSPPALSRHPSVRTQGSVTPRIFTFESVTDHFEAQQPTVSPPLELSPTASSISRTLDSPHTVNIEIETSTVEEKEDRPSFLDEGQDWFSASPEHRGPAPSPQNPSRTSSLTYRLPSSLDMQSDYSPDMSTLPSQTDESPQLRRPPSSRKLGAATPRIFNFEFISDDEEESKEGNPSPRPRKR